MEKLIHTYEETEKIGPYLAIPLVDTRSGLKKYKLKNYSILGLHYMNNSLCPLILENEAREVSSAIVKRIFEEKNFVRRVSFDIDRVGKKIFSFAEKLNKTDFNKLDEKSLFLVYLKIPELISEFWGLVWIFVATDFPFETLRPELIKILAGYNIAERDINVILSLFQKPELRKLYLGKYCRVLKKGIDSESKLINILKKYYWIHWVYDSGLELNEEIIKNDLNGICAFKPEAKSILNIKFKKADERLLSDLSKMAQAKAVAKEKINLISYHANRLFKELEERLKIGPDLLRTLLSDEMKSLLLNTKINLSDLEARLNESVYLIDGGIKIYLEKEKIRGLIKGEAVQKNLEIRGQVAFLGKATGRVCVIKGEREMSLKKFVDGSVLVSVNTSPNMFGIMLKATAIITDIGGITSHAAIVSRELKIPCIIGTKIATKVLKDGDLVEVDAEKGIVKIIKRAR